MAYYSSTFNTLHKPKESEDFYNFKSGDIYKFLDFLFLTIDANLREFDYSLKTPKNILISFGKEEFRVFLGDEKAIVELNTISYEKKEQEKLPTLKEANAIGTRELGFTFDCYFDVSIIQVLFNLRKAFQLQKKHSIKMISKS